MTLFTDYFPAFDDPHQLSHWSIDFAAMVKYHGLASMLGVDEIDNFADGWVRTASARV